MLVIEKQLSPCSRDMAFTGDRFVGVVNFTSMLIEDNVLQHCNRSIQLPIQLQPVQGQSMLRFEMPLV
jgi:hypothetical protein